MSLCNCPGLAFGDGVPNMTDQLINKAWSLDYPMAIKNTYITY